MTSYTDIATQYIAQWDSYESIEATAFFGLSDEDVYRLRDAYGDDAAEGIRDEIERQCRRTVAVDVFGSAIPETALALKFTDPTESARWIDDESDLADIERADPSLVMSVR